MNKVIYLTLTWLLLAPISVFGQMGGEVHYSQIWVDASESDPADETQQGRIYIIGGAVTQDDVNPYNHQYRTTVALTGTNGQSAYGDGGASFLWNGVTGNFSSNGTHITTCPVCMCDWENFSNTSASVSGRDDLDNPSDLPWYVALYYNFDSIVVITDTFKICGYVICEWSKNCDCGSAWYRHATTYKCSCETPCPEGFVQEYARYRAAIPIFGIKYICKRYSRKPLSWDPCVPAPSWDPVCSVTQVPKFPYP